MPPSSSLAGSPSPGKTVHGALALLLAGGCDRGEPAFEFAVVGDAPYVHASEALFASALRQMDALELAFVVHVGDVQAPPGLPDPDGVPTCTDACLAARRALFDSSRHPFVLTPGDNDWYDCAAAGADPLERLERVRAVFFAGDTSLGRSAMPMTVQAREPGFERFVENRRWTMGGVSFATLHVLAGAEGAPPALAAEARERDAANLHWLARTFADAHERSAKAVVLFLQANPLFEADWTESQLYRYLLGVPVPARYGTRTTSFDAFRSALRREVEGFARPVLLVHGDSHTFRLDKPLAREDGTVLESFTRLETFGHPDVHWVRVRIDPDDPDVFAVQPVTMPR